MTLGTLSKAAADVLDYDVDFSRWLPGDDRIVAAIVTVSADTVTIDSHQVSDTQVKVWISGGAEGDDATVTVVAETEDGRFKEACFRLRVRGC